MNEMDERGRTLLYVAARRCNMPFVRRALDAGGAAALNLTNRAGKHALYAAAVGGDPEIVELLYYKDAEIDLRNVSERTALWAACYCGNADAASMLVRLGADPNAADATLVTPLIAAASNGHDAAVRALVTAAEDALDVDRREMLGCTALWAAAERGAPRDGVDVTLRRRRSGRAERVRTNRARRGGAERQHGPVSRTFESRREPERRGRGWRDGVVRGGVRRSSGDGGGDDVGDARRGRQPRKRRGKYAVDRRVLAREPRLRPRALETPP